MLEKLSRKYNTFALNMFKGIAGGISPTQFSALKAGTVGYEGSLFAGKPDWDGLMNTPAPKLGEKEQAFLDNETEELCAMIDDWAIRDEYKDIPEEVWSYLKDNRFFGMIIPEEYGGLGFSAQAHSAVVSKIGSRSGTVGATTMVPNSLGPGELLMNYGTDAQKDHYLPRLADGREVPCFALTSTQAGSDATNQRDTGVVEKGEDGQLYLNLNWEKRYTTLAPVATLIGVAFQARDPHGHLRPDDVAQEDYDPDLGITLALVPADTPGIRRGERHRPMGTPFQNGPHWGTDVRVPLDEAVIGGRDNVGRGWDMLVDCLSIGRSISLPASAGGMSKYLSRVTGAYAGVRSQFGSPLRDMEGVQEPLARIAGLTYMIDAARILPLQDLDLAHENGEEARPAVASAILKYHTTEAGRQAAIDAMDIHGGKGVCEGPNNPVGAAYQGCTVGITVEGANIMTRSLMIFGQGAFMAHPYVLDEIRAGKQDDPQAAGQLLSKHIGYAFNSAVRSFAGNLLNFGGRLLSGVGLRGADPDAAFRRQINRISAGFAVTANLSMLSLKTKMMFKERHSALLGDCFSNLYLASQVLRKWDLDGRPESDKPYMTWAAQRCIHNAESALHEAVANHPSPVAGAVSRLLAFPLGRHMTMPSHKLDGEVAQAVSTPGGARDSLTRGMYLPQTENDYLTRLEKAFGMAERALPLEKKLNKAVKKGELSQGEDFEQMVDEARDKNLLSEDESTFLREFHKARFDITSVDCFPQDWHGRPVNPYGPEVGGVADSKPQARPEAV